MRKLNTTAELTRHFLRRFFENDLLESDGDTSTTVARGLAIVAAPGLILAFFLQNSYPERPVWGRIEDQYFFVLFSFVTMAGLTLFEWEMLFPERLDFLVLTPLPLRPKQLLFGKAAALSGLLGLFLIAANLFGVIMLPAVSKEAFWRMVWAQSVATSLAGVFAAAAMIATGGLLLCVLPPATFRRVSCALQMGATAALVLLVLSYARFGDEMARVLEQPGAVARWVPTIWFLGVYQRVLHGDAAQAFALPAAQRAWTATGVAACIAVLLYPVAWVRMQRMAMQGEVSRADAPVRWWAAWQNQWIQAPVERAVLSFIGKTMGRNSRYQVYLAIYGGVGLALSVACVLTFREQAHGLQVFISEFGLHAVLPLLLFWTVAGLHVAFAFPQNLPARWIFRIAGVDAQACVRATRHWVFGCELVLVLVITATCAGLGWSWRALLVQAVWGACFAIMLVETFFVAQRGAPFTRPRSPGKTSLPAVLTLYLGVLPPSLFAIAWAEVRTERKLANLIVPTVLAIVSRILLRWARQRLVWVGEETEGADGEIQLLGLAGQLRA